ncbi:MAG: hypothetical protein JSS75_03900 [Bacteroidetes bacterium]|nr:hypothetical protein [Bacteroidota bacterium]
MKRVASIFLVYIGLCCLTVQVASAQWSTIGTRRFSAFDMVTPHHGLAATSDVGLPILCLYDADTIGGILTLSNVVTSIIAVDSNTAYFTVRNDGLYQATNRWTTFTKIYSSDSLTLLAVAGKHVIARSNNHVIYSNDGGQSFQNVNGLPVAFLPLQFIWAVTAVGTQSFVAVDVGDIYLSRDGGANWTTVLSGLTEMRSAYCDHINNIVYVGGGALYRSLDSGAHWQKVLSPIFDLKGAIAGTNDCTGALYIGPDHHTRGELLRTTTLGKFFQSVGAANLASTRQLQMEVFDRGSTVFYLDSSGILSVTRVGVDSTVTDLVASQVQLTVDTTLHNAFCPNAVASKATFHVGYNECTAIRIDSIKLVKPNPAFAIGFVPVVLGDSSIDVPFTYRARSENPDSARCRMWFHSTSSGNHETIDFMLRGIPDLGQAGFTLSTSTLDFGKVPVDSTKRFSYTVTNSGCDTLVIDAVASSDPSVFILSGSKLPIVLAPGGSTPTSVGFKPHEGRQYLESVNIHTNLGMRFVVLKGIGVSSPDDTLSSASSTALATDVAIYPNPATDWVRIPCDPSHLHELRMFDALGRSIPSLIRSSDASSITLDIHSLHAGTYSVVLGTRIGMRFIKE